MKNTRFTLAVTSFLALAGAAYFWILSRKDSSTEDAQFDPVPIKSIQKKKGTELLRQVLHEAKQASAAHHAEIHPMEHNGNV